MAFSLSSPDFVDRGEIPWRHARAGDNLSPILEWKDPPGGTRSFVLMLEDVDAAAPAFRHWAVYDIPEGRHHMPAGRSSAAGAEVLPQGVNDYGNPSYDGPDPPQGSPPHTYRFRLFALDTPSLDVGGTPTAGAIMDAAREHILAEAELTGTYSADGAHA